MGLMEGKKGLVFGVANDRSYATFIAKRLLEHGAECGFTYLPLGKMQRRVNKALEGLGLEDPWLVECDAGDDEQLDACFEKFVERFGRIDFIVHSIAFADRGFLQIGNFHKTSRSAFSQALDISAYTLVAMTQRAIEHMPEGGSIISMSYYGGEKVIPGYNVMGVAKAALEHSTRYLAAELGSKNIRINSISGGPLRTLAASAVGEIDEMFEHHKARAPLQRNINGEEVGDTAVYLLSDMSSAVTGEVIHVDSGFNIMGA
ncbi:MAG: enoyl-ACP reductase [Phycisphaeraceae bacterium]|nr:enoyl-ACP reductase [Phycisphaeraceae bacterium]